jgi:hypothetical protein
MKSMTLATVAIAAVLVVLTTPILRLRAEEKDDSGGLKRFEVECIKPTIGGPEYNCTGDLIGHAHLTDAISFGTFVGADPSGSSCSEDSATDTITAADGSTITLQSHGMICFEPTPGFAVRHNAYLIEGGTGRFRGATGTGDIVLSSENPIGLPLAHIDGNINIPNP